MTVVTNRLSTLVNSMAESETLKMARMARELKAQGYDVISLSLGEPDFDTPVHIKEAAKKALDDGYTHYTPVAGLPELTEAISKKFKRDNDLDYAPNQIVVSNGAKQSIANLSMALLDEGDEAIVFAPYWVSYSEIIKMAGGVPVFVKAGVEQDFKVTAAQVEAAITDRTRFVLFSSPCNPTGSVFTYDELKAIAEVLAKYENIIVISDEIYEYINFTGKHVSIGSFDIIKDRTVTVNGFAKGFAMTGWRLGYMGAPKWIADACTKIQGQITSGATAFGQKAGAFALMSDLSPTYEMREAFRRRRELVIGLLSEIPGFKVNHPQGAFYSFPDISAYFGTSNGEYIINNADDFCDYIMMHSYVGLVSGSAFGDDNCFRLSYAASEENLREAVRRISVACGELVRNS
jgi:aspartate aminotransferase